MTKVESAEAKRRARSQAEQGQGAGRPIYMDMEHVQNYGQSGVGEGSQSGAKLFKEWEGVPRGQ